jgi:hypothetical protein
MLKRLCVDTRHPPLSVVVSCTRIEGAVTDTLACVMWDQCALFVGKSMSDRVVCRVPNTAFLLLVFAALLGSCSSADFAKFQADTNASASASPNHAVALATRVPAVHGLPTPP